LHESGPIATLIDYNTSIDTNVNSRYSPDLFELTPIVAKIKGYTSVKHTIERYFPYSTNKVTTVDEHIKYGTYKPMSWTKEVS